MSDPAIPVTLPTYRRQWWIVFALAGSILVAVASYRHLAPEEQPSPLPDPAIVRYTDWFQIVRCPEMPVGESEDGERVGRLVDWLTRLRQEGFYPRTFAEVMQARKERTPLPEGTVVLAFLPAYRVTIEQVLPRLRETRTPALFVTLPPGRTLSDRRFVSDHTRRTHSETGLWDLGVPLDERTFLLEAAGWPEELQRDYTWAEQTGITGLNFTGSDEPLNILHANARWSADEFVNRLKADLPVRRLSRLSMRRIEDRNWGIVADADDEVGFDLLARPDARFASVTWAGTRGVGDLEAELRLDSWFGEVWLFLRSNTERTERIRVGLTGQGIRLLQERNGEVLSDKLEPAALNPGRGVHLIVRLEGRQLRLRIPDRALEVDFPVVVPASEQSCLELALYHRVHGAAIAREIALAVEPIGAGGISQRTEAPAASIEGKAGALAVSESGDSVPVARP